MERLTIRNSDWSVSQPTRTTVEDVFYRLAAYEDTGLGPEEVEHIKNALIGKAIAEVQEFNSIPIKRLQELAQAEKDGRLVVLPCKPDAVAWAHSITGDLSEFQFEGIYISEGKEISYQTYWGETFSLGDFGKTVFLTREEAEAALKKREEADNETD